MSNNSAAFAALDEHIANVRTLPEQFEASAPEIAAAIDSEIKRSIASGLGPDGESWKLTKDGKKPLADAGKSVGVAAVGRTIFVRAWDHIARHSLGRARGGAVRRIVPVDKIPESWSTLIGQALVRRFEKHMGGDQ